LQGGVVLDEELLLGLAISFARHQLGLFVNVTETVQQCGHATFCVGGAEAILHPVGDRFRRQVQVLLQVGIQDRQLLGAERTRAAADTGVDTTQRLNAALAIALEMVAYRVGFDLQNFGNFLRCPTGGKQHDRLPAVGLALVLHFAVCRTQLGEHFR
jgi:hypothetical protein